MSSVGSCQSRLGFPPDRMLGRKSASLNNFDGARYWSQHPSPKSERRNRQTPSNACHCGRGPVSVAACFFLELLFFSEVFSFLCFSLPGFSFPFSLHFSFRFYFSLFFFNQSPFQSYTSALFTFPFGGRPLHHNRTFPAFPVSAATTNAQGTFPMSAFPLAH